MFTYSFAGDPALVAAVRNAWPKADAAALCLLKTLEEIFAIDKFGVDATNRRHRSAAPANF